MHTTGPGPARKHPMRALLDDLAAEQADLDRLVAPLPADAWDTPTPAERWTIRDQIGHLAFFDEKAALSASDPDAFADDLNQAIADGIEAFLARHLERARTLEPADLLAWWRQARSTLLKAMTEVDPDIKVPWYGPPMKAASSVVARLMETWAHGQDVADALGVERTPTARLQPIAELGVKTFSWSFRNRGLDVPERRVRVELRGPAGEVWVWNDDASDSVTGPALDFCLVVAQRRHVDDTSLAVDGDVARRWMEIAQVFAGPPGPGRRPSK